MVDDEIVGVEFDSDSFDDDAVECVHDAHYSVIWSPQKSGDVHSDDDVHGLYAAD